MIKPASYVDGLCNRIDTELELFVSDRMRPEIMIYVRKHVEDMLGEIQHRLYQDVAGNLLSIAETIDPSRKRQ